MRKCVRAEALEGKGVGVCGRKGANRLSDDGAEVIDEPPSPIPYPAPAALRVSTMLAVSVCKHSPDADATTRDPQRLSDAHGQRNRQGKEGWSDRRVGAR